LALSSLSATTPESKLALLLSMSPLATIGILSVGEMGMGIAQLLLAHNYRVVTNLDGRRWDALSSLILVPFCALWIDPDVSHLVVARRHCA
jgi:hypothetical protein